MDVRTLCLGILTFGDATGYEIKKAFQDRLSMLYDAGYGSIYPALNKLTSEGLVSCRTQSQSKRPDKKIYSITLDGRIAFLKEMEGKPAPDKFKSETLATLMFAHLLPANHVSKVIDNLIQSYEANIEILSGECDMKQALSEKFLCGYGIAVKKAAIQYMQDNRHLIEAEALLGDRAAE
ncbi:MAG: PadR family transcriptional regulator [Sneathiella sp.]|nr:PadR family transcriptional regulator [Sneathiella sp.]